MRTLTIAALTLEPQVAAHAVAMFTVLSDPAIYEFENEPPSSVDELRERFARLESRRSADGRELWLNWVIRLPTSELIGYVQATVAPGGRAFIAYELASRFWGRGLAQQAVVAMLDELGAAYGVRRVSAVLQRVNLRSRRLLDRLGFEQATPARHAEVGVEAGEWLMERELTAT